MDDGGEFTPPEGTVRQPKVGVYTSFSLAHLASEEKWKEITSVPLAVRSNALLELDGLFRQYSAVAAGVETSKGVPRNSRKMRKNGEFRILRQPYHLS